MPAPLKQWPAWTEYAYGGMKENGDLDFLAVKKAIIAEYGTEALRRSWIKVCNELQKVTDDIRERGNKIIPVYDTAEILKKGFTDAQKYRCLRLQGDCTGRGHK